MVGRKFAGGQVWLVILGGQEQAQAQPQTKSFSRLEYFLREALLVHLCGLLCGGNGGQGVCCRGWDRWELKSMGKITGRSDCRGLNALKNCYGWVVCWFCKLTAGKCQVMRYSISMKIFCATTITLKMKLRQVHYCQIMSNCAWIFLILFSWGCTFSFLLEIIRVKWFKTVLDNSQPLSMKISVGVWA